MTVWTPKNPNETVAYIIDWSEQLGVETIVSYIFARSSGDAVIGTKTLSSQSIKILLSGGTDATTSEFLNTIITSGGQTLERAYSLYVSSDFTAYRPSATTKRTLIDAAFNDVALNSWELDITPEEKDTALTRLDALAWELLGRGINLGYNFPTAIGGGNLDDELGCPDQAFNGLSIMLAKKMCPTMGKKLSQESREALSDGIKAVRACAINYVPSRTLPRGTPLGSGNKPWTTRYPFVM